VRKLLREAAAGGPEAKRSTVSTTSLSRRAVVVAVSAATLFPSVAAALPADSPGHHPGVKIAATKSADPQSVRGDNPSQYAAVTGAARTGASAPAIQGDTPSQYAAVTGAARTDASAPAVQGDTPSQYAAVTGAPQTATVPVEIVRPERTIVRDRVPSAPVVLAGLALVVALIGAVDLRARRRTLQAGIH
jgi:hypothetical protein